jgi:hypothetical protein
MSFEISLSPLPELALAGMGCYLLYWSWRGARVARETSRWTPVTSTILRARAKVKDDGYEPDIAYRYTIGGKDYESSQVSIFFAHGTTLEAVRRKAHKYSATQRVIAYVNPANHAEAVLEPGPQPFHAAVAFMIGLLFIAIGGWMLVKELFGIGV